MNYLRAAAETLQTRMEQFASETVMYCRDGQAPFPVVAVPGRTVAENQDASGFIVRTTTRDFTIRVAALRGLTPKRNDVIKMKIGNEEHIYTVNGDFGGVHYEPVDSYGIAWRIHTKLDRIDA